MFDLAQQDVHMRASSPEVSTDLSFDCELEGDLRCIICGICH